MGVSLNLVIDDISAIVLKSIYGFNVGLYPLKNGSFRAVEISFLICPVRFF